MCFIADLEEATTETTATTAAAMTASNASTGTIFAKRTFLQISTISQYTQWYCNCLYFIKSELAVWSYKIRNSHTISTEYCSTRRILT